MDMEVIEKLADVLIAKGLGAIESERDGWRIRVESQTGDGRASEEIRGTEHIIAGGEPTALCEERLPASEALCEVTSPLVGVVYLKPDPEQAPYVAIGDRVERGAVLCVVEAMKMFNEVTSPVDGIVMEICTDNEAVVEYGACLFRLKEV